MKQEEKKVSQETNESVNVLDNQIEIPSLNEVPYINPANNEYPIIAYNNVVFSKGNKTNINEVRTLLQTIKDCGYNVNLWACAPSEYEDLLNKNFQVAEELGLKTVLSTSGAMPYVHYISDKSMPNGIEYQPSLLNCLIFILNLYKKIDNLWGYFLMDEPQFGNWGFNTVIPSNGMVDFPTAYRSYLQNANGHCAFFNLAVNPDDRSIVGENIYNLDISKKDKFTRYLEEIKDKFIPSMMSVDIYPVIKYPADSEYSILYRYYFSMEAIGDFSRKYNMPFWMFLLSNQHNIYDNGVLGAEYPYPSKEILRFQAMTALAYGFQGIVFWTYGMKNGNNTPSSGTVYITASYDDSGSTDETISRDHLTEVWNNCKAVISMIKQYGKVLLNAKFEEARHVYGPLLTKEFDETTTFSSAVGCIISASASGMGFVITRLTKGDIRYVAIVSHDPYREQNIRFTIPKSYNWHEVLLKDQAVESQEVFSEKTNSNIDIAETITRTLGPGQMILISY